MKTATHSIAAYCRHHEWSALPLLVLGYLAATASASFLPAASLLANALFLLYFTAVTIGTLHRPGPCCDAVIRDPQKNFERWAALYRFHHASFNAISTFLDKTVARRINPDTLTHRRIKMLAAGMGLVVGILLVIVWFLLALAFIPLVGVASGIAMGLGSINLAIIVWATSIKRHKIVAAHCPRCRDGRGRGDDDDTPGSPPPDPKPTGIQLRQVIHSQTTRTRPRELTRV